jgi:hypothetical protein
MITRFVLRLILSIGIVLVLAVTIGLEAKYQLIAKFASIPWFTSTCTLVLIILFVLYVIASCAKALREREYRQNAEQLFVGYIEKPGADGGEFYTLLDRASNTQLSELEVFKEYPTGRDVAKIM